MKWQNKDLRSEILKMKREMTDELVFLSDQYLKLLCRIAKQITRTHFKNIHIDNDRSLPAGCYNGSSISVNLANPITQSFPSKELKNKSLIGILGHECGHENYSNSYLRTKYLNGILAERKIYPHAPMPKSPEEQQALKSMQKEFDRERSAAVILYGELAGYLSNVLEDIYIEHRMCGRFPGNIKEGIMLNNMRIVEMAESVRSMLNGGQRKSIVVMNMITQYAISGQINCWDGADQEYLDCLEACKPLIDKAVREPEESARYIATNQILLKMWDFVMEDAMNMEAAQSEKEKEHDEQLNMQADSGDIQPQANMGASAGEGRAAEEERGAETELSSDNSESSQEEATETLSASEQEAEPEASSGAKESDTDSMAGDQNPEMDSSERNQGLGSEASSGNDSKFEMDTSFESKNSGSVLSQEGETQIRDQIHRLTEALPQYSEDYQGGRTNEAEDTKWDGSWDSAQEVRRSDLSQNGSIQKDEEMEQMDQDIAGSTDSLQWSAENAGERPDFDKEASAFVFQIAKDMAEIERQEQIRESMQEFVGSIDFGDQHVSVQKYILRALVPDGDYKSKYAEIERQLKHIRKHLHDSLLPVLEKQKSRMQDGMMLGRRMSNRTLYRPDHRIFARRLLEGNVCDTAIAILVDMSGSMYFGNRLECAKLAALTLYQFSVEADIPVTVYGHYTSSYYCCDETVCLCSFAEFDLIDDKDRYRIMDMQPDGRNRDGVAVRFVGELLRGRPEKQKLFVLISDGQPNAEGYCGSRAKEDLKNAKAQLEHDGITFLAAAIGDDRDIINEIYGESLDVTDLRKLPELLAKRVLREIS